MTYIKSYAYIRMQRLGKATPEDGTKLVEVCIIARVCGSHD